MNSLQRFLVRTARPFFLFTGAGTALVGLYAVLPSWTMPNGRQAALPAGLHHHHSALGIMVGLMGVVMMAVAVAPQGHVPIFPYSAIEKSFMSGSCCPIPGSRS